MKHGTRLEPLMRRVCHEHGVDFYDTFVKPCRRPAEVWTRDRFLALVRWSTGLSLPEIGREVGMDHTSVLVAVRRHEATLNPEVA